MLCALLTHATNTQIAGHNLASSGCYAQATALVRICAEDWLAFWYVKNFPEDTHRFLRRGDKRTPDWNHMTTRLESRRGQAIGVWRELRALRAGLPAAGDADPVFVSRLGREIPPFAAVYAREPSGVRQRSVGGDP